MKIEQKNNLISIDTFKEFLPNLKLRMLITDPQWMRNRRKTSEDFNSQRGEDLDYYLLERWVEK